MSALATPGLHHDAGGRNRNHEQIDQHQVDGKQPGGPADLVFRVVLHHRDVELARQQHDAHQAQERDGDPEAAVEILREYPPDLVALCGALDESADAPEDREDDEEPDRQKGCELDERLGRDGHDQAFLVFGGVDVPGPEQDGKGGHQERDHQCRVEVEELQLARAQQRRDGEGHGFELQGNVGERSRYRDDRDDGANGLALAVAGGQKVGDRGDVVALGQPDDTQQEAPAEHEQQDGAEIDRNEIVAGRSGKADAAEEGP